MSERVSGFQSVSSTQLGNAAQPDSDMPAATTNLFNEMLAGAGLVDTSNVLSPTLPISQVPDTPSGGYMNEFDKAVEKIGAELKEAGVQYDPGLDI